MGVKVHDHVTIQLVSIYILKDIIFSHFTVESSIVSISFYYFPILELI